MAARGWRVIRACAGRLKKRARLTRFALFRSVRCRDRCRYSPICQCRPAYAGARNIAAGTARFTATDLRRRLIRSISCMVCAVNQDSPQCGHEIRGMPSITSRSRPLPKLRVKARSVRPVLAQCTQGSSERIDGDENEPAAVANLTTVSAAPPSSVTPWITHLTSRVSRSRWRAAMLPVRTTFSRSRMERLSSSSQAMLPNLPAARPPFQQCCGQTGCTGSLRQPRHHCLVSWIKPAHARGFSRRCHKKIFVVRQPMDMVCIAVKQRGMLQTGASEAGVSGVDAKINRALQAARCAGLAGFTQRRSSCNHHCHGLTRRPAISGIDIKHQCRMPGMCDAPLLVPVGDIAPHNIPALRGAPRHAV